MRTKICFLFFSFYFFSATTFGDGSIDSLFQAFDSPSRPGASVMVIDRGRIHFAKAYGLARLAPLSATTTRTNYRLASLTKQFTAMAIAQLIDRGLLSYYQKVTDVIEGFPAYAAGIEIQHLIHHTSGLRDYENHLPQGQTKPLSDHDVVQILQGLSSTYFAPGSQYRYSNSGYATLAVVVEKVSGQSFASFLQENIFIALGMGSTVAFEKGVSTVSNRAYGYTQQAGSFTLTDQSLTSSVLGDGGVYSSVSDLYIWDQALHAANLLSESSMSRLFAPGKLQNGAEVPYGFGWVLDSYQGHRRVSHTGSTVGFRTAIQRLPDRQLTVIVLINQAQTSPWTIAKKIVDQYITPIALSCLFNCALLHLGH